jgi:hypothetical protein
MSGAQPNRSDEIRNAAIVARDLVSAASEELEDLIPEATDQPSLILEIDSRLLNEQAKLVDQGFIGPQSNDIIERRTTPSGDYSPDGYGPRFSGAPLQSQPGGTGLSGPKRRAYVAENLIVAAFNEFRNLIQDVENTAQSEASDQDRSDLKAEVESTLKQAYSRVGQTRKAIQSKVGYVAGSEPTISPDQHE